jgi:hypothetical protein
VVFILCKFIVYSTTNPHIVSSERFLLLLTKKDMVIFTSWGAIDWIFFHASLRQSVGSISRELRHTCPGSKHGSPYRPAISAVAMAMEGIEETRENWVSMAHPTTLAAVKVLLEECCSDYDAGQPKISL